MFPTTAVLGQMDRSLGMNSHQSQAMGMPQVSLAIPIATDKGSGFLRIKKGAELDFLFHSP